MTTQKPAPDEGSSALHCSTALSSRERLVYELRTELQMFGDEPSDDQILERTQGTLLRSRVELRIAVIDFGRSCDAKFKQAAIDIRNGFGGVGQNAAKIENRVTLRLP